MKIGFMAGLSGRVADLGVSGRNGLILAIEQKNGSGGINGKPLELIVRDDRQDSQRARSSVKELLDDGVELIIGPMTSSMAMSVVKLVNNSDAYLLSPTVTTTDLLNIDDHFLRVISSTKEYGNKSATYQYQNIGSRKAVAEGVYVEQFLDRNDTSSRYREFRKNYRARFGQPPVFAGVAGYDAGVVAIEALETRKKSENIKDAIIRKKIFQCVQQEISIDRFGDADRNTYITKTKSGQYITIE